MRHPAQDGHAIGELLDLLRLEEVSPKGKGFANRSLLRGELSDALGHARDDVTRWCSGREVSKVTSAIARQSAMPTIGTK